MCFKKNKISAGSLLLPLLVCRSSKSFWICTGNTNYSKLILIFQFLCMSQSAAVSVATAVVLAKGLRICICNLWPAWNFKLMLESCVIIRVCWSSLCALLKPGTGSLSEIPVRWKKKINLVSKWGGGPAYLCILAPVKYWNEEGPHQLDEHRGVTMSIWIMRCFDLINMWTI